eukprot:TRINITY_DN3325_c0_g3_i2.p1 TRINITY_DN3325_c0_g3~~TRINITY_DN3325_c0_g3_i2.p1  ORF type:complete len:317 (+),score=95.84 TRINITY_DN3325_c0_g3_i2:3-953(+)
MKQVKYRPIEARKTKDSEWRLIMTNMGYQYYYNVIQNQSSWLKPYVLQQEQHAIDDPSPSKQQQFDDIKRKLHQEEQLSINKKPKVEESIDDNNGKQHQDHQMKEEEEQNGLNFEERVEIFKQMLKEKHVGAFSTWEKELSKFAFDPRFKILPDHSDRRAVFQSFTKNKMEDERKEKTERMTLAKEDIYRTMKSDHLHLRAEMSFEEFKQSFGGSEHFKNLASKEKEKLFSEMIEPIKQASLKKETEEKEKASIAFRNMLKQTTKLTSKMSWFSAMNLFSGDPRLQSKWMTEEDRISIYSKHVDKLGEQEKKSKGK